MNIESRINKLEAAGNDNGDGCTCESPSCFTVNTTQLERGEALPLDTVKPCARCGRLRRTQHFTINLSGGYTHEHGN